MAHDFVIKAGIEKGDPFACFSGYATGIFYSVFNANQFDAGMSGSNQGKWVTQQEAAHAISAALESDAIIHYPDPTRADGVKDFYEQHIKTASSDAKFYVHFS